MPVTPITPAQIDEVGKGASASPSGHSRAEPSGLGPTAECPSRGPAASTGPIGWAWEYHCGGGEWSPTISDFRPSDASWRRNIRPLYDHPLAFAAANPSGGIDDAIALVKREFPGWAYALDECHLDIHAWICPDDGTPSNGYDGWGETMALAIVDAVKNAKEALGTEARSAETGTGSVEDEGPACKATPSLPPPPSPRNGQEENPCPMTVEEARVVIAGLGHFSHLPNYAQRYAEVCRDLGKYTRASEIELALSTIRASEEDR